MTASTFRQARLRQPAFLELHQEAITKTAAIGSTRATDHKVPLDPSL
jgi:hypothetical protein